MRETAIIVPCYNESKRLSAQEFITYSETRRHVCFIFVNDGSSDDTFEIIQSMCRYNPEQMLFVDTKKNVGKAEAVRQGFLRAFDLDCFHIGYWDADLAAPLTAIDELCELMEKKSVMIAFGSRVRLLGSRIERKLLRRCIGRVFSTCAGWALGFSMYDTQCGAKVFKNTSELKAVFSTPFAVRWTFDVEILARFKIILEREGAGSLHNHALEYPLREWTHVDGSKVRPLDVVLGAVELLRIYRTYMR